jgi:hypothetical protein
MIGSVKQEGKFVQIFDENGKHMDSIGLDSDQVLRGYSNSIIVAIKEGGFVSVYDERGRQKCVFRISSLEEFLAVVGETIHFKEGHVTKIYDSNGNHKQTI